MNNTYTGGYSPLINNEEFEMKRQISSVRSQSNKVGFFVTAYFLSMFAINIALGTLTGFGIIPQTRETEFFTQIIYAVGASFIPGIIFMMLMKDKVSSYLTKTTVRVSSFIPIIMFGMGVAMLANIAASLFDSNISLFNLKNYAHIDTEGTNIIEFLMSVISTALVPAFAEEFAFRGLALSYLRKHGDAFAIFTSALLFGAMHGNTTQIVFAFLLGLIFAFVDVKTNSIIPSVIIHFINNFYAVLTNTIISGNLIDEHTGNLICYSLMAAFSVIGLLSAVYLANADKNFFKLNDCTRDSYLMSFKQKIGAFYTNPGVLIAMSMFTAEMLVNLIPPELYS